MQNEDFRVRLTYTVEIKCLEYFGKNLLWKFGERGQSHIESSKA